VSDDLALALDLADRADALTMAAFTGSAVASEAKADGTPVTETDRAVEAMLRDELRARRPDDGFVGEETGGDVDAGARRWIVDPIDGTQSFAAGGRAWATQLALVDGDADEVLVGVTSAPAVAARWYGARDVGSFEVRAGGAPRPLRVSDRDHDIRWTCHPPLDALPPAWRTLADRLAILGRYERPREHGALMVARGDVDICLQLDGAAWDYAAFAGVVTRAGGRFSYLDRSTRFAGVQPGVFSNGVMHDGALGILEVTRWDGPSVDAWRAWTPHEAAARLAGVDARWCVVGGWSIDLSLGAHTREHGDLEIAVVGADFPAIRAALDGFDLLPVGIPSVRALEPGEDPPPESFQCWVLDREANEWRMDVMREPGDETTWVFRRDERITAPRSFIVRSTRDGIPHLAPHGALLYKAKAARAKDQLDFDACLPRLGDDERAWLIDALGRVHPGHPWLTRLA
jgi:fructose-1,6-bisphosphatase/inositol monophosphatase family enzyme